ncbi:MAG: PDZ domain-containing protein [Gammaproteobacteria bacterium]|nr:PDZ domain-containing protein [Gammaproteobacteria bacterium]
MSRLIFALVMALGVVGALFAGAAFGDELEERLREAREQLDVAAERLAEVNREMYQVELSEGRAAKRAMLGVLLNDSGDENGIVIEGVTPGGGAEQAGLQSGDRLVAIGGVRLDTGEESPGHLLGDVLKAMSPGDITTVEYVRDDNLVVADVTTQSKHDFVMKKLALEFDDFAGDFSAELSEKFEGLEELKALQDLGKLEALRELGDLGELLTSVITVGGPLRLEDVDPDLGEYFGIDAGVLVLSPPAEDSELKAGDILLEVDGDPVTSAQRALEQLALGDAEVTARVLRQGDEKEVAIDCAELSRHGNLAITHGPKMIQIRRGLSGDHDVEVEILLDKDDTEPNADGG